MKAGFVLAGAGAKLRFWQGKLGFGRVHVVADGVRGLSSAPTLRAADWLRLGLRPRLASC